MLAVHAHQPWHSPSRLSGGGGASVVVVAIAVAASVLLWAREGAMLDCRRLKW